MHGNIYNTSSFQGLQRLKYMLLIYSEMQCFLDFFFFPKQFLPQKSTSFHLLACFREK